MGGGGLLCEIDQPYANYRCVEVSDMDEAIFIVIVDCASRPSFPDFFTRNRGSSAAVLDGSEVVPRTVDKQISRREMNAGSRAGKVDGKGGAARSMPSHAQVSADKRGRVHVLKTTCSLGDDSAAWAEEGEG